MLAPDTILQGRYRIVRQLGQGGMGAVYEAVDQRLDTTVALKETLFTDERLSKQFEREARLLARLHHPALPRVSDHFSEGDGQFLVMQFIPGDDLSGMMAQRSGPFPIDQVLTWADQLLDALDYLHTQEPQIVHRDIKPQNLKLTARGQIILLDFGLAKGQTGEISRVTTAASIFGYTPNYAPLEQIQGLGTDSRSDIYSLGATLYHLLTGIKPPDALTRAAALVNGQEDPLLLASAVNNAIAPELAAVLQKAMAQNREQRHVTAAEMRKSLHGTDQAATVANRSEAKTVLFPSSASAVASPTQVVGVQPTVATGETTVVRRAAFTPKKRPLAWLASVALLLLVAIGVYGFYLMQKRNIGETSHGGTTSSPTPVAVGSPTPEATAPATESAASTPTPTEESKPKGTESTAKKTERPARSEDKRTPTQTMVPTPPDVAGEHGVPPKVDPNVPPVPDIERTNKPRKARTTTTRVTAAGVVIRNFPDGSQMITMPDGSRVFVGADGSRQFLRPGQRPIRQRPPTP